MLKHFLLGSAVALSMGSTANAMIIDTFSEIDQSVILSGPELIAPPDIVATALDNAAIQGGVAGSAAASIIGGYRDVQTTLVVSPSATRQTHAVVDTSLGTFSHSQDVGVGSHTYITWNGLGGIGLGSADLTDGGVSNAFHLVVNLADASALWSLQLFDGDSNYLYSFINPVEITSPTHLFLPFSIFTANGIDMTDINKIVFGANIDNHLNFDTELDFFGTTSIPEPASMALIGAGLMGLGSVVRRRKA